MIRGSLLISRQQDTEQSWYDEPALSEICGKEQ